MEANEEDAAEVAEARNIGIVSFLLLLLLLTATPTLKEDGSVFPLLFFFGFHVKPCADCHFLDVNFYQPIRASSCFVLTILAYKAPKQSWKKLICGDLYSRFLPLPVF